MIVRALRRDHAPSRPAPAFAFATAAAAAAAVVLWLAPATFARGDSPRGADWAAKDSLIYVEATHPGFLIDRLHDPKVQERLKAFPQYSAFLKSDNFKQLQHGVTFVASMLDTTWDEGIRKLAGGGLVLAVEPREGGPPSLFIAITPTDAGFLDRAVDKVVGLARADMKGKGAPDPYTETTHRGSTIYQTKDGAFGIVAHTLIVASNPDAIKRVADRAAAPGGPSITADAEWKNAKAKAAPDTLAWAYVRLDALRKLDPAKFTIPQPKDPGPIILFGAWYEAARKAPWIAARLTWTDARLAAAVTIPPPPGGFSEPNSSHRRRFRVSPSSTRSAVSSSAVVSSARECWALSATSGGSSSPSRTTRRSTPCRTSSCRRSRLSST
jgi:hypothetical protein